MRRLPVSKRGDGGTALVEFALCVGLLATLTFGVLEFGWAWKQRIALQAITRGSGRVSSKLGNNAYSDREALRGILESIAKMPGGVANVRSVVFFKATCTACTDPYSQPGQVDPQCDLKSGTPPSTGVTNKCNVYFPSTGYFTTTVLASTTQWGTGSSPSLDRWWSPTTRVNSTTGTGPDYVGIRINYTHNMLVGFFGSTIQMADAAVFRLEPA